MLHHLAAQQVKRHVHRFDGTKPDRQVAFIAAKRRPVAQKRSASGAAQLNFKTKQLVVLTLLLSLLLVFAAGPAAAGQPEVSIQSVSYDEASGFVTVKGQLGESGGRQATLTFTDPAGKLDYMNQSATGANGFFAFTYLPGEPSSGAYLLRAGGEDAAAPAERTVRLNEAFAGARLTGAGQVQAGATYALTFGLSGASEAVIAQDLTVQFDDSKLEFVSAKALEADTFKIVDYRLTGGKLRLLSTLLEQRVDAGNADYMVLTFKAKADAEAGMTSVAVSELIVASSNGAETSLQGVSHTIEIGKTDKTALNALIAESRQTHDGAVEGNKVGQYPAGSKAAFLQAIGAASLVAKDEKASQAEVTEAAQRLNAALQAFKLLVITSIPGDNNNDNRVSIGDLAILAKSYGMTSASPGWSAVQGQDLNRDGKIDIEDLAALARLIFSW